MPAVLRAVLFDLDNTLVDRDRAFRDCIFRHFHESGIRHELFRLDNSGYGNREMLFAAWRRYSGMAIDQELFGRMIAEEIHPDGDLLEALNALSQILKLGIISNGGSSTQRRKWAAAGLSQVIPSGRVLVSAEVGVAKPDRRIFLMASQTLGEAPGDCLYLGDHERNDLHGATAAGMRARLVETVLTAERLNAFIEEECRP